MTFGSWTALVDFRRGSLGVLPEAAVNVKHGLRLLAVSQLYWPH